MEKIAVINPWSHVREDIAHGDVTAERLEELAHLMDDEIREEIHAELAPCTPWEFWAAYVTHVGPEEAGFLWCS